MAKRRKRRNPSHRAKRRRRNPSYRRRRRNPGVPVLFANPRRRRRRKNPKRRRRHNPRRRFLALFRRRSRNPHRRRRHNPHRRHLRRRHHNPRFLSLKKLAKLALFGGLGVMSSRIGSWAYGQYLKDLVSKVSTNDTLNEVARLTTMGAAAIAAERVAKAVKISPQNREAILIGGLAETGRQAIGLVVKQVSPSLISPLGLSGLEGGDSYGWLDSEDYGYSGLESATESFDGVEEMEESFAGV